MEYRLELPAGMEALTIVSVSLKTCVNPTTELMPGGVCAALLEVTARGETAFPAGTEMTLYRNEEKLGVFIAQKPQWKSGLLHITAYDRVSLLDVDLGQWLHNLPGWPYTLKKLTMLLMQRCGLEAVGLPPLNQDLELAAFASGGVTGRVLMQWLCQLGGCFCRANPDGKLAFEWFFPTQVTVAPTGDTFYYADSLSCADYTVPAIEKVQLRLTQQDLGAVYPDTVSATNAMVITGNYLLTSGDAAAMEQAAERLYRSMKNLPYTPCKVTTLPVLQAGDIFTVVDTEGVSHRALAMTCTEKDGVLTVECTGSAHRESSAAVNTARYEAISGNVLKLQADVEGLHVEHQSAQGDVAALQLQVEGICATVSRQGAEAEDQQMRLTSLTQTAEALRLQVERGTQSVTTATGYTFDENGLRIAKAGQEMENLLDNTGMYVSRSGEVILQANAQGVQAADVTVRNYLMVGSHARFEDYADGTDPNRTACFYLE